jgi:hypothetical protein
VNGWQLPQHITTASPTGTVDELVFDDMLVNPPLTKADFPLRLLVDHSSRSTTIGSTRVADRAGM